MEDQMTREQAQAYLQLWHPEQDRTDEEVGALIATAYPEITVQMFVNTFLASVDENRFDSDTGHVDCPVDCLKVALAYQRAGGRLFPDRDSCEQQHPLPDPQERAMRAELVHLFEQFCQAVQAVIDAGADVRAEVNGKLATILKTEAASTLGVKVNYITSASSAEQIAIVSPFAHFDVAFTDV